MGLYNILFIGGLVLAILFLILSVIIFFVLKIPKVFGVVSGRTEKKAIQEIRESGYSEKKSTENKSRRRFGGTIHARDAADSDKLSGSKDTTEETAKPAAQAAAESVKPNIPAPDFKSVEPDPKTVKPRSKRTYDDVEETELLSAEPVMMDDETSTEVLTDNSEADTDLLFDDNVAGDMMSDYDAPTDVLSGDSEGEDPLKAKRAFNPEYEEKTDVLKALGVEVHSSNAPANDAETEVLSGEDLDEVETIGGSMTSDDIIGRYSPEETAVLRSTDSMAPLPDQLSPVKQIVVIYKETVVHTDETLV